MKIKDIPGVVVSIGRGLSTFNLFPPPRSFQTTGNNQGLQKSDWEAVGADLRTAMNQIDLELARKGMDSPRRRR